MAEIKSTLDLVLEKTRGLQMSAAEREALRHKEFSAKVKGILQRLEDGGIRLEDAAREVDRLTESLGGAGREKFFRLVTESFDLEGENRHLLELMENICGANTGPVDAVLAAYRDAVRSVDEGCADSARAALKKTHRISGSAVVALPPSDPAWAAKRAAVKVDFSRRLEAALAELGTRG